MAGGQGTRFWPLSVAKQPKQFLRILGEHSMLQETVARLQPFLDMEDIFVVSSPPYLEEITNQLPELNRAQLIVEPAARNTAPCIGLAAMYLQRFGPDDAMVVLPSDHVIRDVREFHQVLEAAEELAQDDWLITFSINPTFPATGYGYVKRGEELGRFRGRRAYRVEQFLEKPDQVTAQQLWDDGRHYWNSGMFVWKIESILKEIGRTMPHLHAGLVEIGNAWDKPEKIAEVFAGFQKVSIDYGVMERAQRVATLPCSLGWSDVGGWNALSELLPMDRNGIAANCRILGLDSQECLVFAQPSRLVALLGVQDLVLVEAPNALLVCAKDRTEEVKQLVERLRERGLHEHL